MADDRRKGQKPEDDGFGALDGGDALGNLPPLSDFESSDGSGFDSEGSLPPLGSLDLGEGSSGGGGLPPIDQLDVAEPDPTGGAIKAPPPGYEQKRKPSATSSGGGFDSPSTQRDPFGGTGFQDLNADSDFSPATPDMAPGPDSDMETPMFDSAFGGGDSFGGSSRPAPTQSMETPMFGDRGVTPPDGGMTFDDGAFDLGGGEDMFDGPGGTPMPDFSPDTGAPRDMGPGGDAMVEEVFDEPAGKGKKKKRKAPSGGGGGPSVLVTAIVGIAAILIGVVAGSMFASKLPAALNPQAKIIADHLSTIGQRDAKIANLEKPKQPGEPTFSPEELAKKKAEYDKMVAELASLQPQYDEITGKLTQARTDLTMIEDDIEAKNEEYIDAQDKYEELVNETSIVRARHTGLLAEVDRLTEQVGQLEDANARRLASKKALEHDIERLSISIKEGMPLTPEKYSRTARMAAVDELKVKIEAAKWVTPSLLEAYTQIFQREMEIASAKEYFFARVPVTDKFGSVEAKWAECLMMGNWAVYYRTLDGKNIGIYEDIAEEGPPRYGFKEDMPPHVQKEVEEMIISSRVEDYQAKVKVLAEKEAVRSGDTSMQQLYDSL